MVHIERFISNFKKGFEENQVEDLFLNGNCYHFALILHEMYDAEIVYDPHTQHFLTKFDGNYYDITGRITAPLDEYFWDEMESVDEEEYQEILRTCVYKM